MPQILENIGFVANNSKHVHINKERIPKFCKDFDGNEMRHWLNACPLNLSMETNGEKLNFLLVFNSISFCYWGEPKWAIEYKGNKYNGSWGMIASLERALDEGKYILNPKFLAAISEEELGEILRGNIEIPLLAERCKILSEVGRALNKKFNGNFSNLVNEANGDGIKLLNLIVSNFPSFNDFSRYAGKNIYFYKRAQLLVSDIYQLFNGKGYGKLKNMDKITACADYKLPWVLRRFRVMSYSTELTNKIDNKIQIKKGSEEEIEIRANTIMACELIKEELRKNNLKMDSIHVNDYLWLMGQKRTHEDEPYHRTLTTFY
ncbi:MAG: hypothetical protein COT15_03275 [Candidatus Diapherotrites archaeon CG08_land_8_20_14_0_20_34_12]|nr:MAG: hypothetical protein COT15_03275 [Candidatus Diapherotrites archaeon CG08_land_8_20_14_0_20_34_12]